MSESLRLIVADGCAAGFGWRLVSGNGRAVARSAGRFDERAGAVASFEALFVEPDELTTVFVHPSSAVAWTWSVVDASGTVVASAERIYDRYGTCIAACRRFVAALHTLGPDGALRLIGSAQ